MSSWLPSFAKNFAGATATPAGVPRRAAEAPPSPVQSSRESMSPVARPRSRSSPPSPRPPTGISELTSVTETRPGTARGAGGPMELNDTDIEEFSLDDVAKSTTFVIPDSVFRSARPFDRLSTAARPNVPMSAPAPIRSANISFSRQKAPVLGRGSLPRHSGVAVNQGSSTKPTSFGVHSPITTPSATRSAPRPPLGAPYTFESDNDISELLLCEFCVRNNLKDCDKRLFTHGLSCTNCAMRGKKNCISSTLRQSGNIRDPFNSTNGDFSIATPTGSVADVTFATLDGDFDIGGWKKRKEKAVVTEQAEELEDFNAEHIIPSYDRITERVLKFKDEGGSRLSQQDEAARNLAIKGPSKSSKTTTQKGKTESSRVTTQKAKSQTSKPATQKAKTKPIPATKIAGSRRSTRPAAPTAKRSVIIAAKEAGTDVYGSKKRGPRGSGNQKDEVIDDADVQMEGEDAAVGYDEDWIDEPEVPVFKRAGKRARSITPEADEAARMAHSSTSKIKKTKLQFSKDANPHDKLMSDPSEPTAGANAPKSHPPAPQGPPKKKAKQTAKGGRAAISIPPKATKLDGPVATPASLPISVKAQMGNRIKTVQPKRKASTIEANADAQGTEMPDFLVADLLFPTEESRGTPYNPRNKVTLAGHKSASQNLPRKEMLSTMSRTAEVRLKTPSVKIACPKTTNGKGSKRLSKTVQLKGESTSKRSTRSSRASVGGQGGESSILNGLEFKPRKRAKRAKAPEMGHRVSSPTVIEADFDGYNTEAEDDGNFAEVDDVEDFEEATAEFVEYDQVEQSTPSVPVPKCGRGRPAKGVIKSGKEKILKAKAKRKTVHRGPAPLQTSIPDADYSWITNPQPKPSMDDITDPESDYSSISGAEIQNRSLPVYPTEGKVQARINAENAAAARFLLSLRGGLPKGATTEQNPSNKPSSGHTSAVQATKQASVVKGTQKDTPIRSRAAKKFVKKTPASKGLAGIGSFRRVSLGRAAKNTALPQDSPSAPSSDRKTPKQAANFFHRQNKSLPTLPTRISPEIVSDHKQGDYVIINDIACLPGDPHPIVKGAVIPPNGLDRWPERDRTRPPPEIYSDEDIAWKFNYHLRSIPGEETRWERRLRRNMRSGETWPERYDTASKAPSVPFSDEMWRSKENKAFDLQILRGFEMRGMELPPSFASWANNRLSGDFQELLDLAEAEIEHSQDIDNAAADKDSNGAEIVGEETFETDSDSDDDNMPEMKYGGGKPIERGGIQTIIDNPQETKNQATPTSTLLHNSQSSAMGPASQGFQHQHHHELATTKKTRGKKASSSSIKNATNQMTSLNHEDDVEDSTGEITQSNRSHAEMSLKDLQNASILEARKEGFQGDIGGLWLRDRYLIKPMGMKHQLVSSLHDAGKEIEPDRGELGYKFDSGVDGVQQDL